MGRLRKQVIPTEDVTSTIGMVLEGKGATAGMASVVHMILEFSFAKVWLHVCSSVTCLYSDVTVLCEVIRARVAHA